MAETIGLGLCGICNEQIPQGTPIWTAVFAGVPKICHKDCHPNSAPTPKQATGAVGSEAPIGWTGPATGAPPPLPVWMRTQPVLNPVTPVPDKKKRASKDQLRLTAIQDALQSSAWCPGPAATASLATDVLDWLATHGWQLRHYKGKSL